MICCDTRCVRRGLAMATAAPGHEVWWRQRPLVAAPRLLYVLHTTGGQPDVVSLRARSRTVPVLSPGANTRASHQAGRQAGERAGLRGQPSRLRQAGARQCLASASGACLTGGATSGGSTPSRLLCDGHRHSPSHRQWRRGRPALVYREQLVTMRSCEARRVASVDIEVVWPPNARRPAERVCSSPRQCRQHVKGGGLGTAERVCAAAGCSSTAAAVRRMCRQRRQHGLPCACREPRHGCT